MASAALRIVAAAFAFALLMEAPAAMADVRTAQVSRTWDWLRDRIFGPREVPNEAAAALDRQGGARVLLRLDDEALRKEILDGLRNDVRRLLREGRIGFADLAVNDGSVDVRIRENYDLQKALAKLAEASVLPAGSPGSSVEVKELGDRLVRLAPTQRALDDRLGASRERAVSVLMQRIKDFSIGGAGVQPEGRLGILLLLPGVAEPERLTRTLISPAKLTFRLIDTSMRASDATEGRAPLDSKVLLGFKTKELYLVRKAVELGGQDIADAQPAFDSRTSEPIVSFRFTPNGARRFAQVTLENVGRPFAIVLDEEVISAPVIREPILGGVGQISGGFTVQEALNLSIYLRTGALPPLVVVEQRIVAPASGAEKK